HPRRPERDARRRARPAGRRLAVAVGDAHDAGGRAAPPAVLDRGEARLLAALAVGRAPGGAAFLGGERAAHPRADAQDDAAAAAAAAAQRVFLGAARGAMVEGPRVAM